AAGAAAAASSARRRLPRGTSRSSRGPSDRPRRAGMGQDGTGRP
ncbi:Putative G-protein coupled receptor 153, partial [Anas platyrhynchos]